MAMVTQYRHGSTNPPPTREPTPPPAGIPPVTVADFPTFNDLRYYGSCCLTPEQFEVIFAWLSHYAFSNQTTAANVLLQIGINDIRNLDEIWRAFLGLATEMAGVSSINSLDLWKLAQTAGYNSITQIQRWLIIFEALSVAAHAYIGCTTVTGAADPRNVVTPTCVGQIYIDTVGQNVFRASGTGSANWSLEYHWT